MSERATEETIGPDERTALGSTLEEFPVRLAVLFGSQADGTAGEGSDIDVGIEFERETPRGKRIETILPLLADLMDVLDRDDIDVNVIGDLDPTVGRAALGSAVVLVGSADRLQNHRRAFKHLAAEEPSLRERAERARVGLHR